MYRMFFMQRIYNLPANLGLFLLTTLLLFLFNGCGSGSTQHVSRAEWTTDRVLGDRLEQMLFKSHVVGSNVSYHVYTPEAYDSDKQHSFPVIYWLHGQHGGLKGIAKLVDYFSEAMEVGKIPSALVVFPNGMEESMWSNSKDGKVPMETVLIDELIPDVDKNFRTIKSSKGRVIEGFSMGGYGAARLGIKYPDIFGAISMLGAGPMQLNFNASSGPESKKEDRIRVLKHVYGNDASYFKALSPRVLVEKNAELIRGRSLIRIAIGDRDATLGPNQEFSSLLKRLNIHHTFQVPSNVSHQTMRLLEGMGSRNWSFYRKAFGGKGLKGLKTLEAELPRSYARQRFIERLKVFSLKSNGSVYLSDLPPRVVNTARRLDANHNGVIEPSEMQ